MSVITVEQQTFFEETVSKYTGYAYAIAFRILGNRDDAEDAVQESFFKMYRHMDRYDSRKEMKNWIAVITVNASRDIYRRQKQHAHLDLSHAESVAAGIRAGQSSIDTRLTVEQIMGCLDLKHRIVIVLFYQEQMPTREISRILKVPQVLVKVRLHRARKKLMRILERLEKEQSTDCMP
ncbi:MAG: hypothetical protein A2268_12245 [Candidatus Raymondbacteria bacterium RifOxyA12_full_50_37]|uniref:RNA polymerase subunit sigma-24 n=1 Tax=Candidatus Raymondbacteria bacterium RIFOXYD12_FULL_49_13 TaxID=1817890 RepID=A0A1F7F2M3_UNCRA|nr:MAG: hypothetical protein A2268_12245 [Candidatus Raymondbacteria bacterium RifOxyA12_full_50_37]OGJ90312.1 MAG: hypothetical protein A2248_00130 [Candidatus Raymondbacteria bacterium RIFOXYA2_FULL_49_16]OGJ97302.1 MAG: hypothetical protein A2453_01590 [Candidatus Raymondbacteria bacterium RIFOXYC2_FULL_50_21]OGK00715.1 MAG: hypothetical protein A2487_18480 [Candidatus Raymondbacteria bacterium RifOxyC12_full_50_8]OGK00915.1 MAG: hypothetical protein A2519_12760 [Candidatus Raymondbacteria b